MTSEWTAVKALTPVVRREAATVAATLALGAGVAASEGIGLGLFMPLAAALEAPAGVVPGRLGALLDAAFAPLAPGDRVPAVLGALLCLLLARNLMVLAHGMIVGRLTSRLAHRLRTDAVAQLLRVEERWVARRETGAWLNLLETQTWETASAVGLVVGAATRLCKIAVFGLGLLWISWRMTAIVAVALGGVSIVVRLLARRIDAVGDAEKRAWEAMAQRLVECLRTLRTIHVFGRERFEHARFAACSDLERRTFQRLQTLQALVPPVSELLVATLMLAVVRTTLATPGELPAMLTFLAILYRLHPQVVQLDSARVALAAALAPVRAVTELLAPDDKPVVRSGSRPVARLERGIVFRDVVFCYDDGTRALDGVGFEIPAGKTTALVGPSGAGKSTVVKLLCRLVDPSNGTIEVDGVPLAALDLAAWRGRVALVGQDLPLLDGSVAENIAYGAPDVVDGDEVRQAARRADADAFIAALPDGYATRVGDGGVRLSGGERQRIGLARALLRDPEVLILDEATSAVDGISAELIARALAEFGCGRTVVVVSHRPATALAADRIVTLDAGRVVEQGPGRELLRRGGLFARLHALDGAPARAGGAR